MKKLQTVKLILTAVFALFSVIVYSGTFYSSTSFQNLRLAIYEKDTLQPAACLSAQGVTTEFQRRGFFRIGVLPLLVLRGVEIQVEKQDLIRPALANLTEALSRLNRRAAPFEIRDFTLHPRPGARFTVQAELVTRKDEGALLLTNGKFYKADDQFVEFHSAILTLKGSAAGELKLTSDSASQLSFNLLTANP